MAQNEPKNKLVEFPIQILTCSEVAAEYKDRFFAVKLDGTVPAAGTKPFGIVNAETDIGETIPVMTKGVAICRAGAALAVDAEVELDAQGRMIPLASGKLVGTVMIAAAQAGDLTQINLA